jgi:hypothetical protein
MVPNMFLAYIRLIFRGSFVEITTAILLVYKILKMQLDVLGSTWSIGLQQIYSESSMTGTDINNQVHLTAF